ncbi:MAG: radical SAM protein [Proteobacteria bacterium]|nr:radical SAM protein [Pseudomonadota bacterium]
MSLAAAMTLGLKPGRFYRNTKLYYINLLLTYGGGAARCSYCGLTRKTAGSSGPEKFIRMTWPTYSTDVIIERISKRRDRVKRICISMITNKKAVRDTIDVCTRIRSAFDIPVSLLIAPTILKHQDLIDFKEAGADKVGVAVDLATPELFEKYRGRGTGGPHQWETYWKCLEDAMAVFGEGMAGAHLMTGMGETEKEMAGIMQKTRDMGGRTHLFSFFPETNSAMETDSPPPLDQYRRIQIARYLIDERLGRSSDFTCDHRTHPAPTIRRYARLK